MIEVVQMNSDISPLQITMNFNDIILILISKSENRGRSDYTNAKEYTPQR